MHNTLREGSKKCESVVFDHLGGGFTKTTPLIVNYIHKGNINYLLINNRSKKFAIRRPHFGGRGGRRVVVKDTHFHIFWTLPLV